MVDRESLFRGFEVRKGEYIRLMEQELDSIEAEANRNIDLKEFVPLASVDPVYFESSYYLGPDKGGEKPYRLLADAQLVVISCVRQDEKTRKTGARFLAAAKDRVSNRQ